MHADDKSKVWVEKETKGGSSIKVVDKTAISRSRLQVDTRKWILSKMLPKLYEEKIEAHTGHPRPNADIRAKY